MRKSLLIIPICVVSMPSLGFWGRPQPLPVQWAQVSPGTTGTLVANTRAGTVKACRRSHLSFNHDGQVSERLIQEGRRAKAIVHCSREAGG